MKATYLLRFDDLCPTMNWTIWEQVEQVLAETEVRPILAVIPDNRDPSLELEPAAADFWERVRDWQARGWTIALHGLQHRYVTEDPGLFGWNARSEFAGLSYGEQLVKLRAGTEIFRDHGVEPEAWVAPNHAFDGSTVAALRACGVEVVSDGVALFPYRDRDGTFWVPMQSWRFKPQPPGVWTVCLHHNQWTSDDVGGLRRDLEAYAPSMTHLEEVLQRYGDRRRSVPDRLFLAQRRVKRSLRGRTPRRARRAAPDPLANREP